MHVQPTLLTQLELPSHTVSVCTRQTMLGIITHTRGYAKILFCLKKAPLLEEYPFLWNIFLDQRRKNVRKNCIICIH